MKNHTRAICLLGLLVVASAGASYASNAIRWKSGAFTGDHDYFAQTDSRLKNRHPIVWAVAEDLGLEGATNVDEIFLECQASFSRADEEGGPIVKARFSNPRMALFKLGVSTQYDLQTAKGKSRVTRRLTEETDGRDGGVRYSFKMPVMFTHAKDASGTVTSLKDLFVIPGVSTLGVTFAVDYSWKGTAEVGDGASGRCDFEVYVRPFF